MVHLPSLKFETPSQQEPERTLDRPGGAPLFGSGRRDELFDLREDVFSDPTAGCHFRLVGEPPFFLQLLHASSPAGASPGRPALLSLICPGMMAEERSRG